MAPTDPPKLPRLPPIRESAEDVVPRRRDDAQEPQPEDGAVEQKAERRACIARSALDAQAARSRRGATGERLAAKTAAACRRRATVSWSRVLALLFGALLMAPGMHKASFNAQPGTKRDVTLALTDALAGISHSLRLDRPRKARPGRNRPRGRRPDRRRDRRAEGHARSRLRPNPDQASHPAKIAFTPEEEAATLDRGRLTRDHAGIRDRPGCRREPCDRLGRRRRRPRRHRADETRCLQLVRGDRAAR